MNAPKQAPRTPRKRGMLHHARHAILPMRGNGHHPHVLKREIIVGVLSLALVLEVAVLAQGLLLFKNSSYLASVLPAVVASLTNDQRTENDLQPLAVSPLLTQAAQAKADDMAAKGYFSHISPDGTLPWHWFTEAGYKYQFAGENLAVNFDDSTDVVNAWMASPMHRANILKQQYTEVGIGMATGMYEGKSTIFVVQFFARPATEALITPSDTSTGAVATTPKPSTVATAVRDVKVALHAVPAPTELMTTATPDSPIATSQTPAQADTATLQAQDAASQVATGSPAVLGTETGTDLHPTTLSVPTFFQKLIASPFTTSTEVFGFIAAFVLAVLAAGLIYRKRLPKMTATIGGLALVVVVLGLAILNQHFVASKVMVDKVPVTQSASAVSAN